MKDSVVLEEKGSRGCAISVVKKGLRKIQRRCLEMEEKRMSRNVAIRRMARNRQDRSARSTPKGKAQTGSSEALRDTMLRYRQSQALEIRKKAGSAARGEKERKMPHVEARSPIRRRRGVEKNGEDGESKENQRVPFMVEVEHGSWQSWGGEARRLAWKGSLNFPIQFPHNKIGQ
jgi:hypothetical protein